MKGYDVIMQILNHFIPHVTMDVLWCNDGDCSAFEKKTPNKHTQYHTHKHTVSQSDAYSS